MTFEPQAFGRLGISQEQVELMDVAERFCRDHADVAAVRTLMETGVTLDAPAYAEMANMGWFGITIPQKYGGVGLSLAESVPVAEQIGRRLMMVPFIPITVAAQAILEGGTEAQKNHYLPKIAEAGGCLLYTSPSPRDRG